VHGSLLLVNSKIGREIKAGANQGPGSQMTGAAGKELEWGPVDFGGDEQAERHLPSNLELTPHHSAGESAAVPAVQVQLNDSRAFVTTC